MPFVSFSPVPVYIHCISLILTDILSLSSPPLLTVSTVFLCISSPLWTVCAVSLVSFLPFFSLSSFLGPFFHSMNTLPAVVNVSLADPVQSPPSLLLLVSAVSRASLFLLSGPLYVSLSLSLSFLSLSSCLFDISILHPSNISAFGAKKPRVFAHSAAWHSSLDADCHRIRWICRVIPAFPAWGKAAASGCSDSGG